MQKQLLIIGIHRNQSLLDGSIQAEIELQMLLNEHITVPNAMLSLNNILNKNIDTTN